MHTHLAVIPQREVEREPGDALGLGTCRHLQALDNTRVALVLKARVLTLSILTNDGKVNVGMAGGKPGERLAEDNRRVDVQLLAHGDVPGYMARLRYRSKENACVKHTRIRKKGGVGR